jgi:hypothetical protein
MRSDGPRSPVLRVGVGRWARRAVTVALAVGAASCASGGAGSAVDLEIRPESPVLAPGATEQFSVTPDLPVRWGVAESPSDRSASVAAFPLAVADDGRYLVDQQDRPWRIQADAAWTMSSEATPDEVDEYLTTRRDQGFNAFYLMAMVHPGGYDAATHAPDNTAGDPPFATPGDFSTAGASEASERYWAWIDSIVENAAAHDMAVMLAYTYLGYDGGDQGWYQEVLDQPSRRALNAWGRWLGDRYEDAPNIIWLGLGDYTPPAGSEGARRVRAIAEGIKAAGATQLFMAETADPDGIPGEVPDYGDLIDLNSFYGYGPDGEGEVYVTADRAWRLSPSKPAWMQEGTYEYEDNSGHFSGEPWDTRRGRFWSVLAGGTAGDGFGSHDVWQWQDVPDSLSTPGAAYASHAFDLFASMPWWELEPAAAEPGRAGARPIAEGQGTWGESDYITAAVTRERDWLLAYVPVSEGGDGGRSFTLDLGVMAGRARARWFDPATGAEIDISEGRDLPRDGTRRFTTPAGRSDGTDDWVLVLDTASTSRCGRVTDDGLYTAPVGTTDGIECLLTATLRSDPSVVAQAEPLRAR